MDGRKTMIEFTDDELDLILEYMEKAGCDTVQEAVHNAIIAALDLML